MTTFPTSRAPRSSGAARRRIRSRVLVAFVAAGFVALLALVAGLGLGADGDHGLRVRFAPNPPPAAPAADLAWWEPVHGEPLGVAVDGDDVAVDALDEVRLVDGATGRTRWKATVPGVRRYRPAVGGDRVAATSETELVVLDRADGARIAAVPYAGPGPAAILPAAGPGGVVIAGSEAGQVVAVDARDGAVLWSVSYPGMVTVAPRGDATTVVASWHEGPGATLRAFDPTTGALRWEAPLGLVAGPPVLSGDAVIVADGEGIHSAFVRSLDLATGRPRWQVPLPGWWEDEIEAAVGPGTVYLLDGMGTVVALDPATGTVRWRQETGRPLVDARLTLTPGAVVFASYDDELMVLDRADGHLRSAEPQPGVVIDVAAISGRLLTALRLASPSRVEARPEP